MTVRIGRGVLGLVVCATGCAGSAEPPTGGDGRITWSADVQSLVPGQGAQVTVSVTGGSVHPVLFSSSNAAVLEVSSGGAVLARAPGTATVVATAGSATASIPFTVDQGGYVTSAGASVSAFGGEVELLVPAGAVTAPVAIRISRGAGPMPDPSVVVGSTIEIAPASLTLVGGARLRLRFDPGGSLRGLAREGVGLRRLVSGSWIDQAGSNASDNDVVEGTIDGGGTYSAGRLVPGVPCVQGADRAFDFWLGAWNVTAGSPPQQVAVSDISLEPGGCAVLEHYRDNGGTVGRSITFRDEAGLWHQTYVDNRGARLLLTGSATAPGVLTLVSSGTIAFQRWTWSASPDGTVRQVGESTSNGGATFGVPFWDGHYTAR